MSLKYNKLLVTYIGKSISLDNFKRKFSNSHSLCISIYNLLRKIDFRLISVFLIKLILFNLKRIPKKSCKPPVKIIKSSEKFFKSSTLQCGSFVCSLSK